MTPSPIAPAPPRTATDSAAGTRPDAGDGAFAATLQHTQPGTDAPAAAHAAGSAGKASADAARDPAPATDAHDEAGKANRAHPTQERKRDDQDDDKTHATGTMMPGVVPPAPTPAPAPAARPARQAPAANGKPVPVGAAVGAEITSVQTDRQPRAATTEARGSTGPAARTLPTLQQATRGQPGANPPASPTPQLPNGLPQATSRDTKLSGLAALDGKLQNAGSRDHGGSELNPQLGNALGPLIQPLHGGAQAGGAAPAQLTLPSVPGQPQFAQHVTQQVAWLVGNHIQQAEIQLNPRALGPIRIDISTHHDHVDVSFAVQNPQTVQALQQTLPQLANLLAQHGLNLGQASVGQQAPGQQHAPPAAYPGGRWNNAEVKVPAPSFRMRRVAPGRVDEFA